MNLNQKSKKTFAVIMPYEIDMACLYERAQALTEFLKKNTLRYAFILHNLDVLDDGTFKKPHMHIYCEWLECCRLNKRLKQLAEVFGIGDHSVSIEKAESDCGCIQYLIHKNNPEKVQYDRRSIIHNFDKDEIEDMLDTQVEVMNFTRLDNLCRQSLNLKDVIEAVGIGMYRAYRPVIWDMWQHYHGKNVRCE